MASEIANENIRFEPDEGCPPLTAIITGFQLAIVMIALVVVPVVIVVRTAEQPESYLTWSVFASLVICGAATIMQAFRVGRLGARHVLVIGTAEPAIAICITALSQGGPTMLASLVVLSSLLKFIVAARLSLLRRVITPVVSGTVLMLIAATVILAVFGILTNTPDGRPVSPIAAPLTASITLAVVTLLLLRAPRNLQALVADSRYCRWLRCCPAVRPLRHPSGAGGALGRYPPKRLTGLRFVAWPEVLGSSPRPFLLITIITSFKAVADISSVQRVSRRQSRASDFRLIQGGLNINGLSNLASGLAGTMPTMTASPSVAMISLTGIASRAVGIWAGIIFIFLALLPKLTAVLLAIPAPVAAAYIMIIMGLVFIEGVETVARDGIDHRKAVVVAVSFWVGMGFQNQAIFADLLTGTWNALLSNSVTSGGLAAALMIGFIELTAARRKHLEVDLDFTSMPEVDRFLQRFAIDRGWNDASIEQLRAVGEETLAIMVLYEDEDTLERRLIINAHVNDDIAELEFLSAAYDVENLEDRLAYMSE